MVSQIRFLMCAPDHYDVDYVINPWMEGNIHKSSRDRAVEQWNKLYNVIKDHAIVDLVEPEKGWPDMVFSANAGLVLGKNVVLSRFLHKERQGEEPYFQQWFEQNSFNVYTLPKDLPFEGAGDALLDREGRWLWAGYGFRSELDSHPFLAKWLDIEVISLRLMDERFYHLDTCFCPLANGYLLYYPGAFDSYSNRVIEMRVAPEKRIPISEADAVNFACNAVNVDSIVIMNKTSDGLKSRLAEVGFQVIETPLTEFLKAGGAAKCLTLRVTEPVREELHANVSVESRVVRMEGHLLDAGLINRALDLIVEMGGSFQVLKFNLGEQRQSTSAAEVRVSAPSHDVMEGIISQLIDLGAVDLPHDERDSKLEPVLQAGVAPDDFYVSTIYPTEIRVNGQWLKVENQRMDGAIAISTTTNGIVAKCKLLRDLEIGEQVVVDVLGIRTVRKAESREQRNSQEFSFMSSGVSSEKRVELVVEQVAWELRKIKDSGGKVVVTAGPVVIHTGGGEHLSRLIREGYVQGLLGGNAIAVHDMEQNILGTSLGVDMKRGVAVRGGHRHHLKIINTVRRFGSISKAVEAGVVISGVMYECVKNNIPFSLAGSIRDDGPLPDTQMNLILAQQEYSQIIQGADMILMLSSMLHSIGVGNMTPAGVKMVCVDINPAVVTKLSDRGSIESVGVVTDVGLFLSLLTQQLDKLTSPYVANVG
ncbi:TIGR00300 family protein [Aphanizomenon flos-aquae NRERC-008]|jgi:lysine-ketoglutarate reductase/saccharopine dehydrogenase-like protein (TIGR00300 family)|uniref:ornithine cyclodeaminase n=1 Tax=Aphanizomenon flos-aquae FACHB-1249 TaxID=2692889 RepID=A0ABR8ITP2_APHFL|nr:MULTISPECIES: TIGR00300 family protein [Aphanizomenon]MCE2904378.1 TIGR00300 family protein [Anabaena sp. CoA2_C59]MDJ0507056.1 TIGR00300 family protein [Nostocales cyanobacterium LE14-WE12]MBD2390299.1 TIGR00300 family protein [Aphanizomenon flos-aquae FACHB-1171]MBD2555582.1 TIGR00300 family protein [Aphanizomenon flos-aquae FACHB-1290]MBD2631419.1 TIGR00300 family protein [Aphanizomenon sp. FACHB-1399]